MIDFSVVFDERNSLIRKVSTAAAESESSAEVGSERNVMVYFNK